MVLYEFNGINVFYEEFLRNIVIDIKKNLRDDNDAVILITGRTGSGKSVLALQIAALVDPNFKLNQVVFRHDQLIETALKLPKYSAIVWDEAREGSASEKALTTINKKVKDFMAEVRQLNLLHIFVMPNFWEFDKAMACYRSDILINVYTKTNPNYKRESSHSLPFQRGHYDVYNFEEKKRLYMLGKKNYENFMFRGSHGTFSNTYTIDEEEYKKRKKDAIRALRREEEGTEKADKSKEKYARKFFTRAIRAALKQHPFYTQEQMGLLLGVEGGSISRYWGEATKPIEQET